MVKKIDTSWEIGEKKEEYRNPFFEIVSHDVVRPDGTHGKYYVLEKGGPFSIIIPRFTDGTTLLVGQYRVPIRQYSWEFPMGMVLGKLPLEIAKQELTEETGYTAKKWKEIGHFFAAPGHTSSHAFVFTAEELTEGIASPEAGEFFEMKRVSFEEIETFIKNQTIIDGPTICSYYLFKHRTLT